MDHGSYLIGRMVEVDLTEQVSVETKIVVIAVGSQHCPDSFQSTTFNEKSMKEQKASQGQSSPIHSLIE